MLRKTTLTPANGESEFFIRQSLAYNVNENFVTRDSSSTIRNRSRGKFGLSFSSRKISEL